MLTGIAGNTSPDGKSNNGDGVYEHEITTDVFIHLPTLPTFSVVTLARLFGFVREAGQNAGQRVEAIQRWCGGMKGDSWCAYFATMILDIAYQGKSPVPRNGVCQNIYELAQKNGWVTKTPSVGDLFLYVNGGDHAHHIGIVTEI